MTKNQLTIIEEMTRQSNERLDKLEQLYERMELILMVREPGSAAAAEAYDGLRKQIIAGVTDRLAHLTQLVQFDAALRNDANRDVLSSMVKSWIDSSGLLIISDANGEQQDLLFEVVENLEGEPEVLEPAYVDAQSNRVIRRGRLRFGAPSNEVAPSSLDNHASDVGSNDSDAETVTSDSEGTEG